MQEDSFAYNYKDWLSRFQSVFNAHKLGLIQPEYLAELQLFLLGFGQFNASFTSTELKRLNYPKSPFTLSFSNAYLRATETWAMQIMTQHYCQQRNHKDLKCVWVDSEFFYKELNRYFSRSIASDDANYLETLQEKLIENAGELNRPWFIEIKKPENGKIETAVKKKRDADIKTVVTKCAHQSKKIDATYLEQKLVYYFKDTFDAEGKFNKTMEVIVFRGTTGEPNVNVYEIINSLGYRIDPIRAMRNILKLYPKLFLDPSETNKFFEAYNKTDYYKKLTEEEKELLNKFQKEIVQTVSASSNTNLQANSNEFISELNALKNVCHQLDKNLEFTLYADYLYHYLVDYQQSNHLNSFIRKIADSEIKRNLNIFLVSVSNKYFSFSVRATQAITEIMELDLSLRKDVTPFKDIVKGQYFKDDPNLQRAAILPYAMRSFVRTLQLLDESFELKVSITNQSYYELLENFEKIGKKHSEIFLIRHVEEIQSETTIIYLEVHPNNVVETKQYAHDIIYLLQKMRTWESKPRVLVLDVTLNALDDPEVKTILDEAKPLIEQGLLNLFLIQSLTKFAHLGLDKRSAGCLIAFNNDNDLWKNINLEFDAVEAAEPVDISTNRFFSYFARHYSNLLKGYVAKINENNRYVYSEILKQLNDLETVGNGRFQITTSSDPKACYVAINMRELLPEAEAEFNSNILAFSKSSKEVENFSQDLLDHLIYPLCEFHHLPISSRASIGFPLTSVNIVYDSLRFTIGIEGREQLNHYVDILAYAAFILNRQRDVNLFFGYSEVDKKIIHYRIAYFNEKVSQYKAMTPNHPGNDPYNFTMRRDTRDSSGESVILRNGVIQIRRKIVPFLGSNIRKERMRASCLSGLSFGNIYCQNVKLTFNNINGDVILSSFDIIKPDKLRYGNFKIDGKSAFFELSGKEIYLNIDGKKIPKIELWVKQGNVIIPFSSMSLEDRKFLILEGAYRVKGYDWPDLSFMRYEPEIPDYLPRFFIQDQKLIMEHDIVCAQYHGVTVYKRYMGKNKACVEIDYWSEKEPVFSRFLSFMTAVLVKETQKTSFLARNYQFRHFLFSLPFSSIDKIFDDAIKTICSNKDKLKRLLDNKNQNEKSGTYSFSHEGHSQLQWPSARGGVNSINNTFLIKKGLDFLLMPQINIDLRKDEKKLETMDSKITGSPVSMNISGFFNNTIGRSSAKSGENESRGDSFSGTAQPNAELGEIEDIIQPSIGNI